MKPHVAQTVADLKVERERLDWIISTLEKYGGSDGPPTPTESPAIIANRPPAEKPKRHYKKREAIKLVEEKPAAQIPAQEIQLMAAARKCAEPFTAESLRVASGIDDTKFITNKLFKWLHLDYIERLGRGEYQRTKQFPQTM